MPDTEYREAEPRCFACNAVPDQIFWLPTCCRFCGDGVHLDCCECHETNNFSPRPCECGHERCSDCKWSDDDETLKCCRRECDRSWGFYGDSVRLEDSLQCQCSHSSCGECELVVEATEVSFPVDQIGERKTEALLAWPPMATDYDSEPEPVFGMQDEDGDEDRDGYKGSGLTNEGEGYLW